MQKMPAVFSLRWAYTMPTVIAAGRAGGTTIVTMSSTLLMTTDMDCYKKKHVE